MKKLIALLLALVMVIGLVACGKTNAPADAPAEAPVEAPADAPADVPADAPADAPADVPADAPADAVAYKENIIIGTEIAVSNIDLHEKVDVATTYLYRMTHDTLLDLDIETSTIVPSLAKEYEWVDDVTLRLTLRDDVKFHNGEPFTADDVVFTFERAITFSATPGQTAEQLESVVAEGDYTVVMKLKEVNVDWLSMLASPNASIMNREAVEADAVNGPAVGCGAWILDKYVPNDYTVVTVNEDYWGEVPVTKQVTLQYIPETSARLLALESGEIDVCQEITAIDAAMVEANPELSLIRRSTGGVTYLAMDVSEPPFDNKDLRLAIAHAIDKNEINAIVNSGYAEIAVSNWGLYTFGLDKDMQDYEYDLDLAKEHLAASGVTEVTISSNTRDMYAGPVTVLQQQLAKIGLTVKVETLESAAMTAKSKFDVHEHEAMVHGYGWSPVAADARNQYSAETGTNKNVLKDATINALIDEAEQEFDTEKRAELYKEVQRIGFEEVYGVPLFYIVKFNATAAGVEGIDWAALHGTDFTYVARPVA